MKIVSFNTLFYKLSNGSSSFRDQLAAVQQMIALEQPDASLAVYVHIPFCESLCTYCGCNTVITRNHDKGPEYIRLLFKELEWYLAHAWGIGRRAVRQVHLGGGTPTFLSPAELGELIDGLRERLSINASVEGSIEGSFGSAAPSNRCTAGDTGRAEIPSSSGSPLRKSLTSRESVVPCRFPYAAPCSITAGSRKRFFAILLTAASWYA